MTDTSRTINEDEVAIVMGVTGIRVVKIVKTDRPNSEVVLKRMETMLIGVADTIISDRKFGAEMMITGEIIKMLGIPTDKSTSSETADRILAVGEKLSKLPKDIRAEVMREDDISKAEAMVNDYNKKQEEKANG